MIEQHFSIEQLLPHRAPIVLVDQLLDVDGADAQTCYRVVDGPLTLDGRLTVAGLMEHAAQSCAARIGYWRLLKGLAAQPGMIIAVRRCDVRRRVRVGELLCTRVHVETEVMDMAVMHCVSYVDDACVAEAELRLKVG